MSESQPQNAVVHTNHHHISDLSPQGFSRYVEMRLHGLFGDEKLLPDFVISFTSAHLLHQLNDPHSAQNFDGSLCMPYASLWFIYAP